VSFERKSDDTESPGESTSTDSGEEYRPEPPGIGPSGFTSRELRIQRRQETKDRSEQQKALLDDPSPRTSTPVEPEVSRSLEPALGDLTLDTSKWEQSEEFDTRTGAQETGKEPATEERKAAPKPPKSGPSQEAPGTSRDSEQPVIGPAEDYAKDPSLPQSEMKAESAGPSTSQATFDTPGIPSVQDWRAVGSQRNLSERFNRDHDKWVPRTRPPFHPERVSSPVEKRHRTPSSPPSSPEVTKRAKTKYWKPNPEFPPVLTNFPPFMTAKSRHKSKKKGGR
jgi:hypothetical protein